MTRKHLLLLGCCGLLLALATPSLAKIVKTARADCEKNAICLYWWPELPHLPGWHAEAEANFAMGKNGINMLIPDGAQLGSTKTVLYGNAAFKNTLEPRAKTLDEFIAGDAEQSREDSHGEVVIADAPSLQAANGITWRTVTYSQPKVGVWEHVAFGEEGNYYIVLTLRSRDEKDYKAAQSAFETLVKTYKP
jgi:hypothetical protein